MLLLHPEKRGSVSNDHHDDCHDRLMRGTDNFAQSPLRVAP